MTRFSILFVCALVACGKGGGSSAAKPSSVKLPKVGLSIDVAGETMVMDGMGANSNMVNGEAKADAKDFNPRNMKDEKLADGWALTYENTGSAGTNYFVRVQRAIAGKTYTCSTTGSQAEQAKAVLAACKSLKP